jgi:hypothetical protein
MQINTQNKVLIINFKVCFKAKFITIVKCYVLRIWIDAKN